MDLFGVIMEEKKIKDHVNERYSKIATKKHPIVHAVVERRIC